MPASFDFDPYDVPLSGPATTIRVCRYDPLAIDRTIFTVIPNVACERIRHAEGPEPPTAWFSYALDQGSASTSPGAELDRLWPQSATGPYVIRNDDRLVVLAMTPDAEARILFDGFAQSPQIDLDAESQRISFLAIGVAVRCWDEPIGGRLQRHADDPSNGDCVIVQLPARFNPDGKPNCTPDDCDVDQSEASSRYPAFLDPDVDRTPDPRTFWTLGKFVRYILGFHNDESFVRNPDFDKLDSLLQSKGPPPGAAPIGTASAADVVIRDFDATNRPWPEALASQLDLAGIGMRFTTGDDGHGTPRNEIEIYRKDANAGGPIRDLLLSPVGSNLNPARCNVASISLRRDSRSIVNSVTVETAQRRVEASFVLAPGFDPAAGDESASQRIRFLRANLSTSDGKDLKKYRYYVADEGGDGHWSLSTSTWSRTALDLSELFPNNPDGTPSYVKRLRAGSSTLISKDPEGRPRRCQLAFSRDYTGPAPALWDGSGHWQPIEAGWQLLEDRLGIYVVAEDPESWSIGDYTGDDPQEPSRTLRGVTSLANPTASNGRFFLRLTTVIDDDLMLAASAESRPTSPTSFTRRRRVDARDHFALDTVAARSLHNPASQPLTDRDDTERALAWARQLRATYEMPPAVGSASLPGVVTAYRVGDRVARINGRDLSLQVNAGEAQGEPPAYPTIAAVSWEFAEDRQSTTIELARLDDWLD